MSDPDDSSVSLRRMVAFFVPLGLSSLLISLSHVIVNGTLTRAEDAENVLAGYALAMSLLLITERPAVLFRQTCSALVRDRISFRAVTKVGYLVFGASLLFGAMLAYTPVGPLAFGDALGANPVVEREAVRMYAVLMFLSLFSGIRCLYQGVIIYRMRTRWLTIGMIFRLGGMFALSQYFLHVGVTASWQGAAIFLFGMIIEAGVSWLEGRKLVARLPDKSPECEVERPRQVLRFYNPLVLSALIVVWISPILNAMLGTTRDGTLAVAAFALSASLMNLVNGFFTYFHQIALQFYRKSPGMVMRFVSTVGLAPFAALATLAFSPLGEWVFAELMGVQGALLEASLHSLRAFLPLVLVFPLLDTLNGIVMARGETKLMFLSQSANAAFTVLSIVVLALALPHWTGTLGALAQSAGVAAEFGLLLWLYKRQRRLHP